jgi:membrane protein YdbS with pleckstrin-like domain
MDDHEQTGERGSAKDEATEAPVPEVPARAPTSAPAPAPTPTASVTPAIADGEDRHVDPRSIHVARLIALPLTLGIPLLPLVLFTVGWALSGIPTVVYLPLMATVLLLAGLAVTIAYRFPAARYRHLRYLVASDGLRIQRGVLWRNTIWIPITRVQHTDVSQGPLQREYDLATLTVHTAGTEGASIPLSGLEHGVATRLAKHLWPERARDAG